MLHRGETDVVMSADTTRSPGTENQRFHRVTLCEDPFDVALLAGHRLAGQDELRMADLAEETWIFATTGMFHDIGVAACAAAGFTPQASRAIGDWDATLSAVRIGLGVVLVPRLARAPGEPGGPRNRRGPGRVTRGRHRVRGHRVRERRTASLVTILGRIVHGMWKGTVHQLLMDCHWGQRTTAESPDHLDVSRGPHCIRVFPQLLGTVQPAPAAAASPAPTRTTHRTSINRSTWNTKTWKPALAAGVITPSRAWGGGRSPVVSGRPVVSTVSTPSATPTHRSCSRPASRSSRRRTGWATPTRPSPSEPILTSCRRRARVGLRPLTPGSPVRRKAPGKSQLDPANIGSAGTGAILGPGLLGGGGGRIGPGAGGPLGGSRWRGSCSRTSNERTGPGRILIAAGFASGIPQCAEV